MALLETRNLSKNFGGVKAVQEVSLEIKEGKIQGLIGPNGSGKTTLFNCLTGFFKPTSGEILFQGNPIHGLPPHRIVRLGIARTFQNLRLFSRMTVLENILVGLHTNRHTTLWEIIGGLSAAKRDYVESIAKARELIKLCGIELHINRLASELPYGIARRLEIARALATQPRLLLLDEPAAGMNPREAEELRQLIIQINRQGITVLLIEHNIHLVLGVCSWVYVMDAGRLIAHGTPEEVAHNPLVIEAYLGKDT